jgi:hypothetical protein
MWAEKECGQRKNVGRERTWAEEGAETVQRKGEDGGARLELSKYSATVNQKDFKLTVIEAALKASRHSSTNAMQCRWCSFDDDHRCRKYVPALSCRSRSKSPNLSTTTKYNTQTKQQQKRQRVSTKSRRTRERGEIPTKDVVVPFPPHFQSAARPSPLRHQAARVVHVLWYRAIDPQHGASVVATVATVATVAAVAAVAVVAVVVLSKKCFQQPSGLLFGPVPRFRR